MIAHRQKGLTQLYLIATCIIALATLVLLNAATPYLPWIKLLGEMDLLPYYLVISIAIFVSGFNMPHYASQLTQVRPHACAALASRQVLYCAVFIFGFSFTMRDNSTSRVFILTYLVLLWFIFLSINLSIPRLIARAMFSGREIQATLIIGQCNRIAEWLDQCRDIGVNLVGCVCEEPTLTSSVRYLGKPQDLRRIIQKHNIKQVVLNEWFIDANFIERIIEICEREGCRFLIHNDYSNRFARSLMPHEEGGHHFLTLQEEPLQDPINRTLKRILDIIIALGVVMIVLPPLCIVVAIMQRVQAPGPMMFVRPRGGRSREQFNMLKFRTMFVNNTDIAKQATSGDSRVYPFGRFLRKSSLDEIPQFVNVLRGEMSVVGPRPHLPQHDEEFSEINPTYHIRSLVKPGITGLAQIRGYRGEITAPEILNQRVYWDLYYVSNWTFFLDLRIIIQTALQVIRPLRSAY